MKVRCYPRKNLISRANLIRKFLETVIGKERKAQLSFIKRKVRPEKVAQFV